MRRDVFSFTVPVADTLTTDGSFASIGTEADQAASFPTNSTDMVVALTATPSR